MVCTGVRGRKFGLDPLGIVEQCFELLDFTVKVVFQEDEPGNIM